MKYLILALTSILIFTTSGFAKNKVTDYFCSFKKNGSEIFLKISEISEGNGNTISASAELSIGDRAPKSIPKLKKISTTTPGLSYLLLVKWMTPELEIMMSQDNSFPSRTFPADLVLSNQPKIRGVCEF